MTYRLIYFLSFCFLFTSGVNAQKITTSQTQDLETLVQESLGQGCVEISNIQSTINGTLNNIDSYGFFEKANSDFPFQNGIVLTTGKAASAGNSNIGSPLNDGEENWGTDPDLEEALGITDTYNATAIEFDFISAANQISFNYLLASEEYFNNYPCNYSDGFAFLIREVGSAQPYQNISLIPNTTTPVNTSTIHEEIVGFCPEENVQYFDGYNIGDTNYNGRTTILTATASIQPNVQYHIKLVIADQNDQSFDSAVFIEGNSFNPSVDLGPDITTCGTTVTLDGDILNNEATYSWFRDGNLISNENNPTLEVTTSGLYRVEITIQVSTNVCVVEDEIQVTLNSEQSAGTISDYQLCDDESEDGIELFDLSTKTPEILASVPTSNYNISYHFSQSDADNNINPIESALQNSSSPQPIFVRIEDLNNGCLAFSTFNLVVNQKPEVDDIDPFEVCDDGISDNITEINLGQFNDNITGGNANLFVSYHYTESDAENGINPIPVPYTNANPTETLFIRVVDATTGCFNTGSISITVLDRPDINNQTQWINACEDDADGFEEFDLTEVIDNVLEGLTGVTVTFHLTQEDAQTGDNPIADETNYTNEVEGFQIIFMRVVNDETGCFDVVAIQLHANILLTGLNFDNYQLCDDASNDGIAEFDLIDVSRQLTNELEDFDIVFYDSFEDQQSESNPLDVNTPYIVTDSPKIIYATVGTGECEALVEITLVINEAFEVPLLSIPYCDDDDDGFASIMMSSFDAAVANGVNPYNVKYYLTEEDAINDENILPPFYNNSTSPETFYVRVTNSETECYDIEALEVTILVAPTVTPATDILVCDDDQDGINTVNLDAKIPEIVVDTSGLIITFHTSEDDGNSGENPIPTPANFTTATQVIYTRVELSSTGCHVLVPFNVYINTEPEFTTITNFRSCQGNVLNQADFFFVLKDEDILNGQTDKQVLYYEDPQDALDRVNEIDKFNSYQNTSINQIIYVRVENLTDQDCFGTSQFTLDVGSLPTYNVPLDVNLCDDATNDGITNYDLNQVITSMSENSPQDLVITFHTLQTDADDSINSIDTSTDFINFVNPQQIFARIENGTDCHSIASFEINVIQLPIINPAPPIVLCDDDYDGFTSFDLTITEVEILNDRPDDIVITYHETIDNLEAGIQDISDFENYTNISNPQTVYVKISNTISNCFVFVPIELSVNLPPNINTTTYETCDTTDNSFNFSEATNALIGNQQAINLSFYLSLVDAENQQNPLEDIFTYTANNTLIYIRATNAITGCFIVTSFNLKINPTPIANNIGPVELCDDDYDLLLTIDLTDFNQAILGNQNSAEFAVSYYSAEDDALQLTNAIDTTQEYIASSETLFVRVENMETACFNITNLELDILRKPFIEIPDQVLCLDDLPLTVSASTGVASDSYLWSNNTIASTINITEIGIYSVTITTNKGCTVFAEFNVIQSAPAIIEFTETIDFSDPNNITVTVSGIGDYFYQLDDGVPQVSNIFTNVPLGPHTITVIDLNGCSSVTKDVVIVDTPKFVTPNSDGYFDTWHITGVEQLVGTTIYIFDRYGKQMAYLTHDSFGWDGTYNGNNMPASDYWFTADVVSGTKRFQIKGHFALRR